MDNTMNGSSATIKNNNANALEFSIQSQENITFEQEQSIKTVIAKGIEAGTPTKELAAKVRFEASLAKRVAIFVTENRVLVVI